jgi:D-alanine-D-alanine ligase
LQINDETQPPPLKVGLTYNLKRDGANEAQAEFDSIETINAIKEAIEKLGHKVVLLEADGELPPKLAQSRPDIVFNIAEGTNGRGREAHIPSLLSYYDIKFTGSDETTLCICLDKALTKRILISHKIKTPRYQIIESADFKINRNLKFPLIAKPNAEGSSKGISDISVVRSHSELYELVERHFAQSEAVLLLEEFIEGREFTVGIVGNGTETRVMRPMEIRFRTSGEGYDVYDYTKKKYCEKYIEYVCPAQLSCELEREMTVTAKKIYEVLGCRDFSRIDFRLTEFNELYFIEINPLAGLTPGYSDFPMIAKANGVEYEELIAQILAAALKRYGIGEL